MGSGDVETVERMFAAFARRDIEAMVAEADPSIEIRPAVLGGLDGTVYRGNAGIADFVADLDRAWREFRVEYGEYRDLGGRVLMLGRTIALGMESGVELDTRAGYLFDLRDGKVCGIRTFTSHADALAAIEQD